MRTKGELGIGGLSVGALAAALALPKCPLCIAALLSALGIGGALVEPIAPVLRPAALAVGLILALVVVALVLRRTRRRACHRTHPPVRGHEVSAGAHDRR